MPVVSTEIDAEIFWHYILYVHSWPNIALKGQMTIKIKNN